MWAEYNTGNVFTKRLQTFLDDIARRAYIRTYMRSIVTDRVAWSVGRSVCHSSEPCKNGWTDRDAVLVEDLGGGPDPPGEEANFGGGGASHCKV